MTKIITMSKAASNQTKKANLENTIKNKYLLIRLQLTPTVISKYLRSICKRLTTFTRVRSF